MHVRQQNHIPELAKIPIYVGDAPLVAYNAWP